jgi:hypothetical protein
MKWLCQNENGISAKINEIQSENLNKTVIKNVKKMRKESEHAYQWTLYNSAEMVVIINSVTTVPSECQGESDKVTPCHTSSSI